ncbi:MAG: thioesterase family protein [Dehalococcoidia bacterium]
MADELRPGLIGEAELTSGPEHAASRFGAAGMEVLATPIMVGLFEHAALNAVDHELPAGSQTVGTSMSFKHSAATPLGAKVRARAELTEVDGRRLVFRCEAFDQWESIGTAEHERFVVQQDRFLARVAEKAKRPPAGQ